LHSQIQSLGASRRLCAYTALGTLGDPEVPGATCSEFTALACGAKRVIQYSTFEAAAADVINGKIEVVLVPAAYEKLNPFIQSADLIVIDQFKVPIPSLVLAGRPGTTANGGKLFHHPATSPLLLEVLGHYELALAVGSNVEACRSVLEEENTICITNAICAERFGLEIFRVIRKRPIMPFIVFAAVKADENLANN